MIRQIAMKNLLIIRGAPGVGKSAVGKLLADHFKNGVSIEIDEVRRMINGVTWCSTREHLDAIKATDSLMRSYFQSNYDPIIILDTLSQGTIGMILDNLPPEVEYKVISLFADNMIIKDRIMARNQGFMDYTLSFKVNAAIIGEIIGNNHLVDTSYLAVTEVFDKIIRLL